MSKLNLIDILSLPIFLFLIVSCNGDKKPGATTAEIIPDTIVEMRYDQIKLAGIDTGKIEFRSLYTRINVNGKVSVAPQNFATVCAPMGGFVKSTSQLPGNFVSKGQVLAIIENQEFVEIQENYIEARDKLAFAEAEYNRHTQLYKEDVYSEQNLQQVTAEYKSLKAQVSAFRQKLAIIGIDPEALKDDNITRTVPVVSPISGFIKSVNVNIGKSLSPIDVLFEIVNNDNMFLELTLFEKDANKVYKGQRIKFFINNETDVHEAVIYQTARSVEADKTYKVFASVTNGCKNLLSGMYVNAVVEIADNKVTALPTESIVTFDDKNYIFIFDRNKMENGDSFTEYQIVEVKKGITDGEFTEVILPSAIDYKKAKVVVKGAYNLLSAKKNAGEMAC